MADDKSAAAGSALENARKHFTDSAVAPFDVPEWGIKVFPKHETLAGRMRRRALCKAKDYDEASSFAYTVICLAMREDGTPHFKPLDRDALINEVDPDVLERVALACLGHSIEAAGKN